MPSTAHRQLCAHAHCSGWGGEGAISSPLGAQGLGPQALKFLMSKLQAPAWPDARWDWAPFPLEHQPEGISPPHHISPGRDSHPTPSHPSCELWGRKDTCPAFLAWGSSCEAQCRKPHTGWGPTYINKARKAPSHSHSVLPFGSDQPSSADAPTPRSAGEGIVPLLRASLSDISLFCM